MLIYFKNVCKHDELQKHSNDDVKSESRMKQPIRKPCTGNISFLSQIIAGDVHENDIEQSQE